MKAFFQKNLINLILCLGELIVGILLLVNPEGFTQAIVMALGAAVAVLGVLNVIRYFRTKPVQAAMERRLAYGLGQLALGAFFLTQSGWLVNLFGVLTRLYGVAVLVLALFRIQQFVDARRLKLPRGGMFSGVTALFTLAYAAMILFLPETTWIFIGVMLLLEALMDILILVFERKAL
ncbi:MAG: DUF308 domain-containing protein [Christensenellaceae bacterium]|nr:DUF308 domain-containing protein [Christensenellaceae bacterium]